MIRGCILEHSLYILLHIFYDGYNEMPELLADPCGDPYNSEE